MLAARDQENLVHAHQATAAAKPLNQGIKQLAPKTPANRVPKTPFKIPLNDENGGFAGGKTGLKSNNKGNENTVLGGKKGGLGDKNAFITPLATRARAPLGMKTTNAKTKAFQTPAPQPTDNGLGKPEQKSASARKAKPRVSHAEMTKLEILGDKDDLEEPEIEYMPPKPKNLPDLPDDHYEVNLSVFENGGLMRGAMDYIANRKDVDGLSHVEREELREKKEWDKMDRREEALLMRNIESEPIPCYHDPECPGELCKDTIKNRIAAEEQYRKTLEEIDGKKAQPTKKPSSTGPSVPKSKTATAALSQPKTTNVAVKAALKSTLPSAKARLNTSLALRPKKQPTPANPSSMRHNAALAASRTTLGYAKGRSASANLRKTVLPEKKAEVPDTTLSPGEYLRRYGEPPFGSQMWLKCHSAGCFDEEDGPGAENIFAGDNPNALDDLIREQAEEEFVLTL